MTRVEDRGDRLIVWNGNSARRGALTPELYQAIQQAVEMAARPDVRAIILTAEGGFFCAGGDLNALQERRALSIEERHARIELLHDVTRAIRACPVPVIAAVEGGAAGAGFSLALACDLIVAGEDATFTASYVKAGLVPDGGLTAALARSVPRHLAMELCLMGQPVTSARLQALGVVSQIVPTGQVLSAAHTLADRLAKGPAVAQAHIRALVAQAYDQTEQDQLNSERDAMAVAIGADEAAEGIAAFLEKRKPRYSS